MAVFEVAEEGRETESFSKPSARSAPTCSIRSRQSSLALRARLLRATHKSSLLLLLLSRGPEVRAPSGAKGVHWEQMNVSGNQLRSRTSVVPLFCGITGTRQKNNNRLRKGEKKRTTFHAPAIESRGAPSSPAHLTRLQSGLKCDVQSAPARRPQLWVPSERRASVRLSSCSLFQIPLSRALAK